MNSTKTDKEGYLLLAEEFDSRGFHFKFLEDLPGGWKIYVKTAKNGNTKHELVHPKKQDAYIFHDNPIAAKWAYPGDSLFGKTGFDCIDYQAALDRYNQVILKQEQKEEDKKPIKIQIPKNKKFLLKDIFSLNSGIEESKVRAKILELESAGTIKAVGKKDNKVGRASKVYIYA